MLKEIYEVASETNIKHGDYKFYNEDGTLIEHRKYKNGKLWNVIAIFDSEGVSIANKGTLINGIGTVNNHWDGKLMTTCCYKDGVLNGQYIKYWGNGLIREFGNYFNGERCGTWYTYNKEGQLPYGYKTICMIECREGKTTKEAKLAETVSRFRKAMIDKDCTELTNISSFPITGDCGLARILQETDVEIRKKMELQNYEISEKLLKENCSILDSIELETLKVFNIYFGDNQGLDYDACNYNTSLWVEENHDSFRLSVGCTNLIKGSIGEYSIIFWFKLIDDEYKLYQISCAG